MQNNQITCFVLGGPSTASPKRALGTSSNSLFKVDVNLNAPPQFVETGAIVRCKIAETLNIRDATQITLFALKHKPSDTFTPRHPLLDPNSPQVLKAMEKIRSGYTSHSSAVLGLLGEDRAIWLTPALLDGSIQSVLTSANYNIQSSIWDKIDLLVVAPAGSMPPPSAGLMSNGGFDLPAYSDATPHISTGPTTLFGGSEKNGLMGKQPFVLQEYGSSSNMAGQGNFNTGYPPAPQIYNQSTVQNGRYSPYHQQQQQTPPTFGSAPLQAATRPRTATPQIYNAQPMVSAYTAPMNNQNAGPSSFTPQPSFAPQPQHEFNPNSLLHTSKSSEFGGSSHGSAVAIAPSAKLAAEAKRDQKPKRNMILIVAIAACVGIVVIIGIALGVVFGLRSKAAGSAGANNLSGPAGSGTGAGGETVTGVPVGTGGSNRTSVTPGVVVQPGGTGSVTVTGSGSSSAVSSAGDTTSATSTAAGSTGGGSGGSGGSGGGQDPTQTNPPPANPTTTTAAPPPPPPPPPPPTVPCRQVLIDDFSTPGTNNYAGIGPGDDNTLQTSFSYSGNRMYFTPKSDGSSYFYELSMNQFDGNIDSCPASLPGVRYFVFTMYGDGSAEFSVRSGSPCHFPFGIYRTSRFPLGGMGGTTYYVDLQRYVPANWYNSGFFPSFAWEAMQPTSGNSWSISNLIAVNDLAACGVNGAYGI